MKGILICLVLVSLSTSFGNTGKTFSPPNPDNKIFIITLDGFRWEEVFKGADPRLISDEKSTSDTGFTRALYWDENPVERREKLLPFFWNVIAKHGELYGNRDYGNYVNVSNPYGLSYPGYNELLTGSVDYSIYNNDKKRNSNTNILQILNKTPGYIGKVAAFTSWDAFSYILDKNDKNGFVLNSGMQKLDGQGLTPSQKALNSLQGKLDSTSTRYDELTYIACKEYVMKYKPSVVFLSFSGTDNAGHQRRYDQYLQEANNADRMIGELWRLLQTMPDYAGKTTFLITTDHGRGKKTTSWSRHGFFVPGSSQTWYALIGNKVVPHGEMKNKTQVYQKELTSLVMDILSRN